MAVTALAGRDQPSAERKAASLYIPKAYGDYRALIADPQIDVVHICSPNREHYPAARAALAAGKHVVCEKPLGMSSAESQELVALAEVSGLVHAVTFNIRYYPLVQQMRAMIARGDLGDIYTVHGGYWQDWLLLDTDYNWRVESAAGGAAPRGRRHRLALARPGAVRHRPGRGSAACRPCHLPAGAPESRSQALDTFTTGRGASAPR